MKHFKHGKVLRGFDELESETGDALAQVRRVNRMNVIDNLSPQLRELINEYGYGVVSQFLALGVTKPRHIKHLVETVLNEFSPTRGAGSFQGKYRGRSTIETKETTS